MEVCGKGKMERQMPGEGDKCCFTEAYSQVLL